MMRARSLLYATLTLVVLASVVKTFTRAVDKGKLAGNLRNMKRKTVTVSEEDKNK